jgi:hypothetical protein
VADIVFSAAPLDLRPTNKPEEPEMCPRSRLTRVATRALPLREITGAGVGLAAAGFGALPEGRQARSGAGESTPAASQELSGVPAAWVARRRISRWRVIT